MRVKPARPGLPWNGVTPVNSLTLVLPPLHPLQREVLADPARFKVITAGRRWGKTRLGAVMCLAEAVRGGAAWWVAPSYPVAAIGWRLLQQLARQTPGAVVRQVDRIIEIGGGSIQVKSADKPDGLRGAGLDFVVMDECAFVKEDAWTEALRPALADRKGRAMFISTPKGHNWFWRLWMRGQDDPAGEVKSWRFATVTNPFIDPKEIEANRLILPERVFAQEFLAEFVDDAGGVFRRVVEAATATGQAEANPDHQYIAGVDVADMVDFTVVSVIDVTTGELCYVDRFNRVGYPVLENRLLATYRRFMPAEMIIESNSIGQAVIDHLAGLLPVRPFKTTSATKEGIIQGLAAAFEHNRLKILADPVLIGELQAYEGKRNAGGGFSYSAPEGLHDDCVMSLALAWHGADCPVVALGSEWQ